MNESIAPIKDSREHHQKAAMEGTEIRTLAFLASKTGRNKCLLFTVPNLWYFVTVARPD